MSSEIELIMNLITAILVGAGLIIPLVDQFLVSKKRKAVGYIIALTSVAMALALNFLLVFYSRTHQGVTIYHGALIFDTYGITVMIATTIGAFLVLVASTSEVRSWSTATSYYSLVPIALIGIYYMSLANDVLLMLTSWTLASVASYVFAGLKKDINSIEGAVKYSIMGILATVTMLYAIAILYGVAGTTNIQSIASIILKLESPQSLLLIKIALIIFIASFGFKFGVFPFQAWLPDVYGGVHPISVAYLAGVIEALPIVAFVRLLTIFPASPMLQSIWITAISLFSILTMTFGNIVALVQRNVQRMLAYSTIAHAGYFLVGFTASGIPITKTISGTPASVLGLQGIALHVIAYIIAKTGLFTGLSYILRKIGSVELDLIKGLGRSLPVTSVSMSILILSLMGLPPLLGFWSKLLLFLSVAGEIPLLALIAALNSGISVAYYMMIIKNMYFVQSKAMQNLERIKDPEVIVIIIASLLTILLGLGIAPYLVSNILVFR